MFKLIMAAVAGVVVGGATVYGAQRKGWTGPIDRKFDEWKNRRAEKKAAKDLERAKLEKKSTKKRGTSGSGGAAPEPA
jgi:hypothetical protein